MNKFFIGLMVLVVVGLIGSILINSDQDTAVASVIELDKVTHDFRDIDIFSGKVETEYVLTNTGDEDVVITSAETSCMCTEGEIGGFVFGMHGSSGNKATILAGESETLTAIYDPLAHGPEGVGKVKRELIIHTNSAATPEIKVTLSANVTKVVDEE